MAAVLAIHGVSNRSPGSFTAAVEELARLAGPGTTLLPVFWGDLGPEPPLDAIPAQDDVATVPSVPGAFDDPQPAVTDEARRAALAGTIEDLAARTGQRVPVETEALLHEAIAEAAALGYDLAVTREVGPLLASAVLSTQPIDHAAIDAERLGAFGLGTVKDALVRVLEGANRMIAERLAAEFRSRERGLGGLLAHTIGDVVGYPPAGAAIRGRLHAAYLEAQAGASDGQVDVVAHSLGALVVVEWLLGASIAADAPGPDAPRRIRNLVTFGTQVSLFAELRGLEGSRGPGHRFDEPQVLPIDLQRWTNVWQDLDPLAFVMHRVLSFGVPAAPTRIEDLRLTQERIPTDLSFHSSYWTDRRFAALVAAETGI